MRVCKECNLELPESEFYRYTNGTSLTTLCKGCYRVHVRNKNHSSGKHKPIEEAKDTGSYLGVVIAEQILSNYFEGVQRMPYGNRGYDYVCRKGHKIDVKSGCSIITKYGREVWNFKIRQNQIADYFLCLAFDNRDDLNPQHVWLIPSKSIKHLKTLVIHSNFLAKWAKYEQPLGKVETACNHLRQFHTCPEMEAS